MSFTELSNHFLIAMPSLSDPNFSRTVSYLCEHNQDGAIGIIINRPLDFFLDEVLDQMNIEVHDPKLKDIPIYFGGPMAPDRGFVLHTPTADAWRSSLAVTPEIHVTTSQDILEAIALGQGPKKSLVALGYSGWSSAQLDTEIAENDWLTVPSDAKIIFETAPDLRWQAAALLLGIDITRVSSDIGHA